MILVDTSVWIDLFEGPPTSESNELERLILADGPVHSLPLILLEVLQGIQEESLYSAAREKLSVLRFLPVLDEDYLTAIEISRACRKKGHSIRRGFDAVIAAVCMRYGFHLLHRDKDFEKISRVAPLNIHHARAH